MALKKTLRWFGPSDKIYLDEIVQTGVSGVVTALHHIKNGELWPEHEIRARKDLLTSYGLEWDVVESVPVHESIKLGDSHRDRYINNYCKTIENLSKYGVNTVCYNFMTVVDWVRTDLNYKLPNGRETMYYNALDICVFDNFILSRPGASHDYFPEIMKKAEARFKEMTSHEKQELTRIIAVDSQNFIDGTLADGASDPLLTFRHYLEKYREIGKNELRENLKYFLQYVIPVAEKFNIRMAIHADDPPFPVFGLQRIVSSQADLEWILNSVVSPSNGLTFCTGSFSGSTDNNITEMAQNLAPHIQFLHLRNTKRNELGDFWESDHLDGVVDMPAVMKIILLEQKRRKEAGRTDTSISVRPDHGHRMLYDLKRDSHPGYSIIGRLKGLSEISGLEEGIKYNL